MNFIILQALCLLEHHLSRHRRAVPPPLPWLKTAVWIGAIMPGVT